MKVGFATLPSPPYYVVVFSSQRNGIDEAGYAEAAQRMQELASLQPGFLGIESARDAAGFGITTSYWTDEASILAWREQAEHAAVRARGRSQWYGHYELRVAKVERSYGKKGDQ